jgi:hypothetical protein
MLLGWHKVIIRPTWPLTAMPAWLLLLCCLWTLLQVLEDDIPL